MPSGKTHDKITYLTTPLVAMGGYYLSQDIKSTCFLAGSYLFAGLMFSGDLDIKSVQSKRWGIFRFIWWPYRKIFSHRSKWTHGVILGTITRLVYLFLIFCIAISLISLHPNIRWGLKDFLLSIEHITMTYPTYMFYIFIGLLLGAFSHTGADVTVSYIKKKIIKKLRFKKSRSKKGLQRGQKHRH